MDNEATLCRVCTRSLGIVHGKSYSCRYSGSFQRPQQWVGILQSQKRAMLERDGMEVRRVGSETQQTLARNQEPPCIMAFPSPPTLTCPWREESNKVKMKCPRGACRWRRGVSAAVDLWQWSQSFIFEPILRGWARLSLLGTTVRQQIIETKSECISRVKEWAWQELLFSVHLFLLPKSGHCPFISHESSSSPTAHFGYRKWFKSPFIFLSGQEDFITLYFSRWQIHVIPLPMKKIHKGKPLTPLHPQKLPNLSYQRDCCFLNLIDYPLTKGLNNFLGIKYIVEEQMMTSCIINRFLRICIKTLKVDSNI